MALPAANPVLFLELLDSAQGQPLQSWRFDGQLVISIGRAEECDIPLADPRVSRLHAELRHEGGAWQLVSRGRNGVLVSGQMIATHPVADRLTFQLGPSGPLFRLSAAKPATSLTATVQNVDEILERLAIDERQKQAEVQDITSGALFQKLKQRAGELRRASQDKASE